MATGGMSHDDVLPTILAGRRPQISVVLGLRLTTDCTVLARGSPPMSGSVGWHPMATRAATEAVRPVQKRMADCGQFSPWARGRCLGLQATDKV